MSTNGHTEANHGQTSSRWLRVVAIGAVGVVSVVGALGLATRSIFAGSTNADADTGGIVEIAMLEIPVLGTIPEVSGDAHTVWQGQPAPDPRFDTAVLGPDLSFEQRTPTGSVVEDMSGNLVYLGDAEEDAMILFAAEAPTRNPWDYVYKYFTGHGDRRLLSATFDCCAMSFDDKGKVYPQVHLLDLESGDVAIAQWLAVPPDTSVVALLVDDEAVGFQRPIGRVASFVLERQPPYETTMIAYDAAGNPLETSGPYLIEHIDLP